MAYINHNSMAANVAGNLNANYSRLATSIQRLSSGLRINSAADDAAGLAIRELMRADVAALYQGARNINDAISLVQTADGALAIIDEKLIRMKELAEQAATGTYDSTQRLMIDSEFQAMASEIDRIANATDFNGIKLLDGSRQGAHDGSGLEAKGAIKVHFGTANDSAEDYYYLRIADCTLAGLGLRDPAGAGHNAAGAAGAGKNAAAQAGQGGRAVPGEGSIWESGIQLPQLNNAPPYANTPLVVRPDGYLANMDALFANNDQWMQSAIEGPGGTPRQYDQNFMFIIPRGTKNVVINMYSCDPIPASQIDTTGDNDIQLFTKSGMHLAGTPLTDFTFNWRGTSIDDNRFYLGFGSGDYDGSNLNSGPAQYDHGSTLKYSQYNGMTIGYSGDADMHDEVPNDGRPSIPDYEVLTIDEATEDLIVWCPGSAGIQIKAFANLPDATNIPDPPVPPFPPDLQPGDLPENRPGAVEELSKGDIISIKTQEKAQKALKRIDDAIVGKDKVRAHLGAMQNRLENSVANITIQVENLLSAESRISDADIAIEMTRFVRNQILTQSATAMLAQANSMPQMLAGILNR